MFISFSFNSVIIMGCVPHFMTVTRIIQSGHGPVHVMAAGNPN